MRIILHSLLVFCLLGVLSPSNQGTALHELIDFAKQHQYQVDYGELLIKESFRFDQFENLHASLAQAGFIKAEQTNSKSGIKTYSRYLAPNLEEKVTIIVTGDEREVMANYHLSGDVIQLFENHENYAQFQSFIGMIYTNEKHDYACIRLSEHDMMIEGNFLKKLQENLTLTEIDRIEEPDFVVISGHTTQFTRKIPTIDQEMNVQISARQGVNERITYMIGTPILTTEY